MRKRAGPDDDAQISTHTVHTTVFTISLARGDRHEHGVDGRECSQLATTLLGKLQPGDVYYSRLESHVVVAEARSCVDLFPVQHIGGEGSHTDPQARYQRFRQKETGTWRIYPSPARYGEAGRARATDRP